jgi:iron complex transport system permease protein
MQTGPNIRAVRRNDERRAGRRYLLFGALLAVMFFGYICTRTTAIGFVSPIVAAKNLYTAAKLTLAKLLNWSIYDNRLAIISAHPYYLETLSRFEAAMIAMALGGAMSVAGAVFQCAFRNPIATPSMLGASSGIKLANLWLVVQFSSVATTKTSLRFLYGYIASIAILACVITIARIMGKKRSSVTDMLLVGSIITRISGQLISYVQYYWLSEDDYYTLQIMNLYGTGIGSTKGAAVLCAAVVVGIVPIILVRFSMNALSFGDEDARCLGINAGVLRNVALICSTILVTVSLIYCGDIGMLSMLVPFLARYIFGSDVRKLLAGSALMGAIIMLLCRIVVSAFAFNQYLSVISVGIIVELISAPLMIFVLLKNRRGWE